jgi:hypothetical protein
MREDVWTTTLHLLVAEIGVMTGGRWTRKPTSEHD